MAEYKIDIEKSAQNILDRVQQKLGISAEQLMDLVQAYQEGRCVVLPDIKYTSEDGENALKSAMNTCYYYNNPVTRYIADAVAEKLTREADLKGEKQ